MHHPNSPEESGEFETAELHRYDTRSDVPERHDAAARDYAQFVNPYVSDVLERLRLDKCFVRGAGHWLWDAEGNRYLDAVSGYGAAPFGHNPDWLWQAVMEVGRASEPCLAQPSLLPGAGELAEALLRHAPEGLRYVTFGNGGAEAVSAAIEACRTATGKPGVISTEGSFHGRTLGARSTARQAFLERASGCPFLGSRVVPYGDAQALEDALRAHAGETAAFIVEPIQGEGGVVEPPVGYLKLARALCDRHGVLLIVDEIQTGLGRTGVLFACLAEGITPDALVLAKALGGGLVPVSASLFTARAYSKEFSFKYASTFGGNALAMRVGLRVVERLTGEEGMLEHVAAQGDYLKQGLRALQTEEGSVIREVRGRGLLLGVELAADPSLVERLAASFVWMPGDSLALFAASRLLNVGMVRIAAAMNGSNVLRVQPPHTITREECDSIIRAFEDLVAHVSLSPHRRVKTARTVHGQES